MFDETAEVFTSEEWADADLWSDDANVDPTVEDMLGDDPSMPVPAPPDPSAIAPSGGFALELDWATTLPVLLSAAELVDAAVGYERLAAWAMARQQEILAEFHRRPADCTLRPTTATTPDPGAESAAKREWAIDEIGLALTLAPSQAATRMAHADRSAGVLRPTRDLLAAGRICPARARLITDMLAEYDDGVAAAVQARVLPRAPEHTWGQLRAALTRAILAVVPDPAHRHRAARKGRRVELWPGCDGMATLAACLTAPEATASYEWITRLARGIPSDTPDHGGTEGGRGRGSMDRRRADVLVALLTGRLVATHPVATTVTAAGGAGTGEADGSAGGSDPTAAPLLLAAPVSAHRPLIHVTVPITTLLGLDEEPGELAGYGPIPAPIARQIATDPDSTWRRLLTDPTTGTLLDYGRRTYRPPTALTCFVRARDGECRYPGCRRPAAACELDHIQPWQRGGTTSEDNLCALCERHHDVKEQLGWRVVLHPDRSMEWITPTGHHYRSRPIDYRPPPQPPGPAEPEPGTRRSLHDLFIGTPPDPHDPPPF